MSVNLRSDPPPPHEQALRATKQHEAPLTLTKFKALALLITSIGVTALAYKEKSESSPECFLWNNDVTRAECDFGSIDHEYNSCWYSLRYAEAEQHNSIEALSEVVTYKSINEIKRVKEARNNYLETKDLCAEIKEKWKEIKQRKEALEANSPSRFCYRGEGFR